MFGGGQGPKKTSLVAQMVKPSKRCPGVRFLSRVDWEFVSLPLGLALGSPIFPSGCEGSLGQEDSLEEEMATHSSILAWRIPEMGEPGGLLSMGFPGPTQGEG